MATCTHVVMQSQPTGTRVSETLGVCTIHTGASLDLYESELGKVLHLTVEQLQSDSDARPPPSPPPGLDTREAAASASTHPGSLSASLCGGPCTRENVGAGSECSASCGTRCLCQAELVGESYALQGEGIVVSGAGKVRTGGGGGDRRVRGWEGADTGGGGIVVSGAGKVRTGGGGGGSSCQGLGR
ncbi:MAG: hypothetical protein WDW36_007798 [Sanguina aurantia]